MRISVDRGGRIVSFRPERPHDRGDSRTWVFERTGLPCRRCGTLVRAHGQGDDNRTTYWCPECQA
jgi:endonuclease VIII